MRSKSIKKIIRKLSRKIICVNDSRYIKFKNFSILIGIFIFIILSTVSDVGAATVGKTIISAPTDPLRNGLVGWWTFDGNNMINNVTDSSGRGNNGYLVNMSTTSAVTAGNIGQALNFDGINDYVRVPPSSSLNDLGPLTYSAWVYLPVGAGNENDLVTKRRRIFALTNLQSPATLYFITSNDAINTSARSTTAISLKKWTHVAVVWNGQIGGGFSCDFYINGVVTGKVVFNTGSNNVLSDTSFDLTIGAFTGGTSGFVNGRVDDVRVYNRMLSASEMKLLYSYGVTKVASTVSSPAQTGLSSGLVGHWTFDGKNMVSNVADSSGQGNNGMMSGFTSTSSAVTAGKAGQGLRFDGSNDYVNITDSDSISPTSAVTISTWMKINESQTSSLGIVTKGPDSADYDYMLYMSNNGTAFWFFMKNSVGTSDFTPQYNFDARDGKWHLYTATFDGDIMRLYIDTTLVSSKDTALTDVRNSSQPLRLGRGWGNYIKGSLDDARVYSRALSLTEIKQLYSQGSAKVATTISRPAQTGLSSGLVGHWTFDGKNMISNVADSSGNGNHGKMSGFTSTSSAVTAGKVGQGLRFDGVNDYVSIADHSSLEGMSSLTISAWVKAVNTGTGADQDILNKGDVGLVPYALRVSGSTGKMNFYVANSSAFANPVPISNSIIPFGIWSHFVGTYDGSTAKLYLNGQLQTTAGSLTGNVNTNSSILAIGRQGPSNARYVSGSLDDVRVYNRALSASEVQQLYNMSK